jgi:hypothetical protein
VPGRGFLRQDAGVSLRTNPVERDATLPDGRRVRIRVGVADDSYIAARELDTVTIELYGDGEHLAAVTTVLDADQESEAHALAQQVVLGLESGTLAPTAGALEPLADSLR